MLALDLFLDCSLNESVQSVVQTAKKEPDSHTYTSLIDACWRAGDKDLAVRTYHNALSSGCTQSPHLYAAAIAACQHPVDLEAVMGIYSTMQQ